MIAEEIKNKVKAELKMKETRKTALIEDYAELKRYSDEQARAIGTEPICEKKLIQWLLERDAQLAEDDRRYSVTTIQGAKFQIDRYAKQQRESQSQVVNT